LDAGIATCENVEIRTRLSTPHLESGQHENLE
jgi:hypothetical protein